MNPVKIITAVIFVVILITGCARRDWIKNAGTDFIGMNFFLFVSSGGREFHAGGQAAIQKDNYFKMRVFDNLLNQKILELFSSASGENNIIFTVENKIVRKNSPESSKIFTHYLYILFPELMESDLLRENLKSFFLENNRIKYIMLPYENREIEIEVQKRFEDGKPKRIKVSSGPDSIVFDITGFSDRDFIIQTENLKEGDLQGDSIFDWVGDYK